MKAKEGRGKKTGREGARPGALFLHERRAWQNYMLYVHLSICTRLLNLLSYHDSAYACARACVCARNRDADTTLTSRATWCELCRSTRG